MCRSRRHLRLRRLRRNSNRQQRHM